MLKIIVLLIHRVNIHYNKWRVLDESEAKYLQLINAHYIKINIKFDNTLINIINKYQLILI